MQRYPFVATQLIKCDRLKYGMVRMHRTVIAGEPFRIGRPYHLGLFRIFTTHGQVLIRSTTTSVVSALTISGAPSPGAYSAHLYSHCLSGETEFGFGATGSLSDSWAEADDVAVGLGEGVLASFSSGAALLVSLVSSCLIRCRVSSVIVS